MIADLSPLVDLLRTAAAEHGAVDVTIVSLLPDLMPAVRREDGSWLVDGMIPIHELKDRLELRDAGGQGAGGARRSCAPAQHMSGHPCKGSGIVMIPRICQDVCST